MDNGKGWGVWVPELAREFVRSGKLPDEEKAEEQLKGVLKQYCIGSGVTPSSTDAGPISGTQTPATVRSRRRRKKCKAEIERAVEEHLRRYGGKRYELRAKCRVTDPRVRGKALRDARELFGRNSLAKRFECSPSTISKLKIWLTIASEFGFHEKSASRADKIGIQIAIESQAVQAGDPVVEEARRNELIVMAAKLPKRQREPIVERIERGDVDLDEAEETIRTLLEPTS